MLGPLLQCNLAELTAVRNHCQGHDTVITHYLFQPVILVLETGIGVFCIYQWSGISLIVKSSSQFIETALDFYVIWNGPAQNFRGHSPIFGLMKCRPAIAKDGLMGLQ